MLKNILQESMNGNALGLKEALQEELKARVAIALSNKISESEEFNDGDRVSWEDPDWGSKHTGTIKYAKGMKHKGSRHAIVSVDNSGGTDVRVNHHYLKKIDESEELDEISKKTLGSYINKASDDAANQAIRYGMKKAEADEIDRLTNRHMQYSDKDMIRNIMKTTSKDVDEPRYKAAKRLHGISKATRRLTSD